MKKFSLLLIGSLLAVIVFAQNDEEATADTSWKKNYRETSPIINDLVHTKLDVKFDYAKSYAYGKVWITLKPHFYSTDSLTLDAKGMDIKKVALSRGAVLSDLKYAYDGYFLRIQLDKTYKNSDKYIVYVEYTAKPNEFKVKGSAAITDAKGLYFINPTGEEKDKPTQIWTQGETEATSVWLPTIDRPNQKTTQEFLMTVPDKYVTLSNGKLVAQKKNADGTRTDNWKMDQPHAPYLFFMGVGDFAVIKDSYKGKEVNYYVEPEYASVAKKIFGNTPEMMAFYSRITGVEYPWVKYSQIVGRDYVSGAMENTTATLHQESAQQNSRELIDGNAWEAVIAHELFHQWFGDYVTTESWSNITVNESFANYSETLWDEYKNGKDAGDAQNYSDMQGYLQSGSEKKDLVRFYYGNKEDVFDAVSYNKGGRVLHMLRNFVGDSAFFKSLNVYLTTNKYKSAEAHQLRLAFEEVTGRDLNWFFNQWYFGSGHPKLTIDYIYDDPSKKVQVVVKQTQSGDKIFKLPVAIDIYNGANKQRNMVWVSNKVDTFTFNYNGSRPDLVNFDGDKILLAEKKDNKTIDNYLHQYKFAGNYLDRREAIDFASRNQDNPTAWEILKAGLRDKYAGLRSFSLTKLNLKRDNIKKDAESIILDIARNDIKSTVRGTALGLLSEYKNPDYTSLLIKSVTDSSYSVAGNALEALSKVDKLKALEEAKKLVNQKLKGKLADAFINAMVKSGDVGSFDIIAKAYIDMPLSQDKLDITPSFVEMLALVTNTDQLKKGVDAVIDFRNQIPEQFGISPVLNNMLKSVIKKKQTAMTTAENKTVLQEQIDYINGKIGEEKKGF